jgi:hypothetical protein
MLVVIFVIAILVSIVVGVASSVFVQAGKQRTRAWMEVILTAVEACRESDPSRAYPPQETDFSGRPGNWTVRDWEAYKRCLLLYQRLAANPQAQARVAALSPDAVMRVQSNNVFVDGFGKVMDYFREGGAGGMPLLLSAGGDGDFGTQDDNVRSDNR